MTCWDCAYEIFCPLFRCSWYRNRAGDLDQSGRGTAQPWAASRDHRTKGERGVGWSRALCRLKEALFFTLLTTFLCNHANSRDVIISVLLKCNLLNVNFTVLKAEPLRLLRSGGSALRKKKVHYVCWWENMTNLDKRFLFLISNHKTSISKFCIVIRYNQETTLKKWNGSLWQNVL